MSASKEKKLREIYYNVAHPAGYSSYTTLRKYVDRGTTNSQLKKFLRAQETYTLHAPARKKFARKKLFVTNIDDVWFIDLMDVQRLSKMNDGVRYLLVSVDGLSRFLFLRALKNKTGKACRDALQDIFDKSGRVPLKICADKGREWYCSEVNSLLKSQDVKLYSTENSDIKAFLAERCIRTLRTKLQRYLTHTGSGRYIDVLHHIVDMYNQTVHSTTQARPADVTENNFLDVWRRLYAGSAQSREEKPRLSVGNHVRISLTRKTFAKESENKWSREIFIVTRVVTGERVTYEVSDWNAEHIKGRFYEEELQRVDPPPFHKVNKILKSRYSGSRRQYYVSWEGYPPTFNSWIRASDLESSKRKKK